MTKEILKELKTEIDSISIILTTSIQSLDYSFYLHSPKSKSESSYIEKSFFFKFTRHTYWRISIIELAKLVSKSRNQHFNIFKLLNNLKKIGDYGKLDFSQTKIQEWEKKLKLNAHILKEIENLRNKIYSHTDADKNKYINSEITFEEIRKIQGIVKKIIIKISKDLLKAHLVVESLMKVDENFKIIKILAENNENRKQKIISDFIDKANKGK